jgi:hypothetical protein
MAETHAFCTNHNLVTDINEDAAEISNYRCSGEGPKPSKPDGRPSQSTYEVCLCLPEHEGIETCYQATGPILCFSCQSSWLQTEVPDSILGATRFSE